MPAQHEHGSIQFWEAHEPDPMPDELYTCPRCGDIFFSPISSTHKEKCSRLPSPEEVYEQYLKGVSVYGLAKMYNCTRYQIQKRLGIMLPQANGEGPPTAVQASGEGDE